MVREARFSYRVGLALSAALLATGVVATAQTGQGSGAAK